MDIFRAVRSGIVVWWQQSYSAPPPPGMYCVSADGAGVDIIQGGVLRERGEGDRCEPLLRERARVLARLTRSSGGGRWNRVPAQHTLRRIRHSTHCGEQFEFGGRSIAAVDQLGCVSRIKQDTADQKTQKQHQQQHRAQTQTFAYGGTGVACCSWYKPGFQKLYFAVSRRLPSIFCSC